VSMEDRRVLRLEPDGRLVEHADLAHLATGDVNEMVVDPQGRAYVGNFGFDDDAVAKTTPGAMMYAPPGPPHAALAVLGPDGSLLGSAPGLLFPNGCALLDEGRLLVVAETLAMRLTAFTVDSDGLPSSPRPWAPLIADGLWEALRHDGLKGRLVRRISSLLDRRWIAERSPSPIAPDGIAVHRDGRTIWVANALRSECVRVGEGGKVLQRVRTSRPALSCVVGGAEGETLFVATTDVINPTDAAIACRGRIEAFALDHA